MTISAFSLASAHHSWHTCILQGLEKMDQRYLHELAKSSDWLPGSEKIFNAFSLPLEQVKYVLFGESPYPREESANGYAFWDNAVNELWSPTGLNKKVNRATSLRNILKMMLVAADMLDSHHTGQENIAQLDKSSLVATNQELFQNFLRHGFLLMNASLVFRKSVRPQNDAKAWHPFLQVVIHELLRKRPEATYLLLGKIANTIDAIIPETNANKFYAEHPYNLSFIQNQGVLRFFRGLQLIKK